MDRRARQRALCSTDKLDNCTGLNDIHCLAWAACTFTGRPCGTTDGLEEDPLRQCREQYGNPAQLDVDGNGIGDKCEVPLPLGATRPTYEARTNSLPAFRLGSGGVILRTDKSAGLVSFDTTKDTLAALGGTLVRTGGQVGACACPYKNPDGSWSTGCSDPDNDICPNGTEEHADGSKVWNPIASPQCNDQDMPNHAEPEVQAEVSSRNICYKRDLTFPKAETLTYHLSWPWARDVKFGQWNTSMRTSFEPDQDHPDRTVKLRVAWPLASAQHPDYRWEVAYSKPFTLTEEISQEMQGEPFLGEAFVIAVIPGWANATTGLSRPAYYLAQAEAGTALVALSPSTGRPDALTTIPPLPAPVSAACAGVLDGATLGLGTKTIPAAIIYSLEGNGIAAAPTARLLAAVEPESGTQGLLLDLASLLQVDVPALEQAVLVPLSEGKGLVLVGRLPGTDRTQAWRLDFIDKAWYGPEILTGLPAGAKAAWNARYAYLPGLTDSGMQIWRLDPYTLQNRRLEPAMGAASPPFVQASAVSLDASGNGLLLLGQTGEDAPTAIWRFDLRGRTWQQLTGNVPSQVAGLMPTSGGNGLWALGGMGAKLTDPIPVSLLTGGQWHTMTLPVVFSNGGWPEGTSLGPGLPALAGWVGSEDAPWPGEPVMVRLSSTEPIVLSLEAPAGTEPLYGQPQQDGSLLAAATCPPGQLCLAKATSSQWADLTWERLPARLGAEQDLDLRGRECDILAVGGRALVATSRGLYVLDSELNILDRATGRTWSAATGLARCGSALCVSRLGLYGLQRLSLDDSGRIQPAGRTLTPGLGWDLASDDSRVFLAQGFFGVGVYDASAADLRHLQTLHVSGFPPHLIITVAVGQGRVFGATPTGTVFGWNLSDLSAEPIRFQVGCGVRRIRMQGRHLLVLRRHGQLDVYDATNPDEPLLVQQVQQKGLEALTATDLGLARFWLSRRGVHKAAYEAAQ